MLTLSLWQPWAWLVACGEKRCETRSWATNYRGPIAIHAAKWRNPRYMSAVLSGPDRSHWAHSARRHGLKMGDLGSSSLNMLPLGCVVAVADLTNVVQISPMTRPLSLSEIAFGDYTTGRYRWDLANVRALRDPIPFKGRQRLFHVPDELVADAIATPKGGA